MVQSDTRPTGNQEVAGFDPRRVRQHSFVEIDHFEDWNNFYGHSLPSADSRRIVVWFVPVNHSEH